MWFLHLNMQIKRKTLEIENLKPWVRKVDPRKVDPCSQMNSVRRSNGYSRLPEKDALTPIRLDRRRCQKRLIKKGRMDMEFLQQVQEELLCSKKSSGMTLCGTREIHDLVWRINFIRKYTSFHLV